MKPYTMQVAHDPPNSYGDCYRTSIACILEIDPIFIPHPGCRGEEHWEEEHALLDDWLLRVHDLKLVSVKWSVKDLEEWSPALQCYHLMMGKSAFGKHSVVGFGGAMAHNPSPLPNPVFGPLEDSSYLITFLVRGARK